jgi:hypothetical protein
MEYRFYATEQAPNGTHDLLITDIDSTIIACIPEALFGVPDRKFNSFGDYLAVTDGESVWAARALPDGPDDEADDYCGMSRVAQIDAFDINTYIAASPVKSAESVLAEIGSIVGA